MSPLTSSGLTKFYRNCYLSLRENQECLQQLFCWKTWQPLIVYVCVFSSTQAWVMLWNSQTSKHITQKPTSKSQLNSALLPSMINDNDYGIYSSLPQTEKCKVGVERGTDSLWQLHLLRCNSSKRLQDEEHLRLTISILVLLEFSTFPLFSIYLLFSFL